MRLSWRQLSSKGSTMAIKWTAPFPFDVQDLPLSVPTARRQRGMLISKTGWERKVAGDYKAKLNVHRHTVKASSFLNALWLSVDKHPINKFCLYSRTVRKIVLFCDRPLWLLVKCSDECGWIESTCLKRLSLLMTEEIIQVFFIVGMIK